MPPTLATLLREVRELLVGPRLGPIEVEDEYLPGLERERRLEGLGS